MKVVIILYKAQIDARRDIFDSRIHADLWRNPESERSERNETCFAGKAELTFEDFSNHLSLTPKTDKKIYW